MVISNDKCVKLLIEIFENFHLYVINGVQKWTCENIGQGVDPRNTYNLSFLYEASGWLELAVGNEFNISRHLLVLECECVYFAENNPQVVWGHNEMDYSVWPWQNKPKVP